MRNPLSVVLLFAVAVFFITCNTARTVSKGSNTEQDPRWAVVDSLSGQGLYASALERSNEILADAQAQSDWRNEFRAWSYRARFREYMGVDMDSTLREVEERAITSELPLKQLLHSMAAEGWWNRYQRDRWLILERTNMQEEGEDPATWSQASFMVRVIDHYKASLSPEAALRNISVDDLGTLLAGGPDTYLRPTLFDLLAHRALGVFANSETRLTEPAWRFTLDDPRDFELFEPFVYRKLEHRDSTAWEFQALRLFQSLEHAHLNDDAPDALVDVTLQRLGYVRERSTLPEKDSLYLNALEALQGRLVNDSVRAEVTVAIARWHAEQGAKYQRLAGDAWKWEKKAARDLCDSAITRFPGSFGAANAYALKASLEQPTIQLQAEEAASPNAPFNVALTYSNVPTLSLRIVKDPLEINAEYRADRDEWLTEQKAVREWSVTLPDDGDLQTHMIELPVEGLPAGRYSLLVSNATSFVPTQDLIAHAAFWCTDLAMVDRYHGKDLDLLVLDRTTGKPKVGVKAVAYVRNRDYTGIRRFIGVSEFSTDKNGMVRTTLNGEQGEVLWSLVDGADKYISGSRWMYAYEQETQEQLRTYLFTDRAIYRPGQEIFFKGIVVAQNNKLSNVRAGHMATVKFYDVNGEVVDTLGVRTDEFGSYHGSFTAPRGALTGSLRIDDGQGSRSIQVEEYKRPTFEVLFDPITTAVKLGEEATVTGMAKSYAGAPLDGAMVQWTVERGTRMPWWCGWGWRGLPWGRETEIASGEAVCDGAGKFTFKFTATADRTFPRDADPVFVYMVNAAATDITGETQQATTNLSVGYRSIEPVIDIGDAIDRNTVESIDIRIENLNGEDMDVPMNVRVVELFPPSDAPQRERLWEHPDRSFTGSLPTSHLANDPMSWPEKKVVLEKVDHRAMGKALPALGVEDWTVGMYRVEVTATDANGTTVKASKLFTVYDTEIQNSGFVNEAFHVQPVKVRCEPGEKAVMLISTALLQGRVLMEVEREGRIAVRKPFILSKGQQRIELSVMEEDRGGFAVHFLCVERGLAHTVTQWIDVPWSNKDLHVEWMSFRDKLLPGSKEEWRLKISGPKKERVTAQLLGVMYDASLDHFVMNDWPMFQWPRGYASMGWQRNAPFGSVQGRVLRNSEPPIEVFRDYPCLMSYGVAGYVGGRRFRTVACPTFGGVEEYSPIRGNINARASIDADEGAIALNFSIAEDNIERPEPVLAGGLGTGPQPVRSDFRETAFFFPDLRTDIDGNVVLRFTTPDALTRWKVMGLAHTKDLQLAQFTKEATTSKPLMVVPNLPRFLREGDRITLTAKINVLEGEAVTGVARIALFDPTTNTDVTRSFTTRETTKPFTAGPGQSANAEWTINVPVGINLASVRITANAAGLGDGEERPLPILTDKILVTESLPIAITKAGTKTFTLDKLKNTMSTTLRSERLQFEYTPNPAWYAVQALPCLMEFPHECAEQTFSRYYANRLATHIVEQRPAVKKVFEQWSAASPGNEGAFLSALEKNADLKSTLLEETPWVVNAKDEAESKRRIALFFDLQRMASEEAIAMKKLRDMQLPEGAWPWWSGMRPSRYITQHIVAGFGHLEALKAGDTRPDGPTEQMLRSAVRWLDAEMEKDYKELVRTSSKESLAQYVPNATDIHFLYARSYFQRWPIDGATRTAVDFYMHRAKETWLGSGLQQQGMLALAFDRLDDRNRAQLILKSLIERATRSEELGMYWKGFNNGFEWWSFPTETHALMIEAFQEVGHDDASVNALKQYLLKLKQTTDWKTTKATSEACYALLLTGEDWLEPRADPVITVGGERVVADKQEAGTGYFTRTWTGSEVKSPMGEVKVTTASDGVQWGALHWQYLERMDKVTPHESPFSITKQVMLHAQTEAGAQLITLDKARTLKAGDKLTIRIELRTDRYVDYVHMKDLRAAGLEPVEAISGYKWQDGLGYYQSIRDAGMHFFFDRIEPGTYVFEYDLRVTHAGDFSNGITTAMCMYAPEFSSHSDGVRVRVGE